MPDQTEVEFRDGLGSIRVAWRDRFGTAIDAVDGVSPTRMPTIALEQNFGMEFLDEDPAEPTVTTDFLATFIDTSAVDAEDLALETTLSEPPWVPWAHPEDRPTRCSAPRHPNC